MTALIGALIQLGQDLPILGGIYGLMYAGRELLRRGPGRSTALGQWLAGVHPRQASASSHVEAARFEDPEEAVAFRLLAESLVQRLDLRPDSQDGVLLELGRERELVLAWLVHEARTRKGGGAAAERPDEAGTDEAI